jgi:hypothetical protein
MAKAFVDKRLKAPATASYEDYSEKRVSYLGNCKYIVVGFVDSQNSFGAKIRANFSTRLSKIDKETWQLDAQISILERD